jgi:branched-subunit amino acid transport protein
MKLWILILAAGLVTFAIRLVFILAYERLPIPDWFRRGLRFVPAAVLTAILVPDLSTWNGQLNLTWKNPQLLAGIAAMLVAWRPRNVALTLVVGLAVFFLLYTFAL